jgi:DNA-binding response OmpR family regulator
MQAALAAELVTLRNRVDDLEFELRELRSTVSSEAALFASWGLTGRQATVLSALYHAPGGYLSKQGIYRKLYHGCADVGEQIIKILVCHVRRKLKAHGVEIENVFGQGYRLTAEGRAVIKSLAGSL